MSKPAGDIDLHALAAFIAHHAPGLGDPMEMPIDSMLAHAHAVGGMVVRQAEAGMGIR